MGLTNATVDFPDLDGAPTFGSSWENKYLYPSFELSSGTVTVRTNACVRPIANNSWVQGYGTGGAGTTTTVDDARFPGGKARKMTWSTLPSNASGLQIQPAAPINVTTDDWVLLRFRFSRSWSAPSPTSTYIWPGQSGTTTRGVGAIDNGDGTWDAWLIVSYPTSGDKYPGAVPATAPTSLSDEFLAGGGQFEKVPAGTTSPTAFPYFDGNTPDAGDFEYVWSGTENASTSIMRAKGILGVSDDGVYQSQEWAAEGTYSAFVPEDKSVKVPVAAPSTVKVIARSAGQTMVGSTGVEVRRNLCRYPNAEDGTTTGWDEFNGTTRTNSTEQAHSGTRSYKVVTPGSSTGEGIIQSVSATVGPASSGSTATESNSLWVYAPLGALLAAVATEYVPGGSSVANRGSTNFTGTGAWQRVIVSGAKATAGNILVTRVSTRASAQAITFYVDDAMNGDDGDYFDGNTPPSADGFPVWAGTENASETILYGATTDTATGADETLEVQATGNVALLGGYWDVLTAVPGTYTGPPFTGSSDIPGYETAWLGAINESASTLTEVQTHERPVEEVISWSITEPGTPHNVHARNGSTGTASITAKATTDTFWTISEDATVTVDGLEGSFEGTIDSTRIQPFNEHGDPSGATTFSVASVLNLLNAERTLPPVIDAPLSDVIQGYVAAVTPNLNITWLAFDDPIRTYGAWSGNVWDILKTVCAANKLEMALSGSTVLVRDLGTQIIRFDDPAHPGFDIENVSLSVTPDSGQYVEITYRDSTAINNQVTYNYVGNPSVEVNATGYGVDIRGFGSVTGSRVSN